jgi:hypothetical protein
MSQMASFQALLKSGHQFTTQEFVSNAPMLDLMRHFLGLHIKGGPAELNDVVIVGLDAEWWEKEPNHITELGFSVLRTGELAGLQPGPHGINFLSKMKFYHVRIQPFSHLENRQYTPGDPEQFHFGSTRFVSLEEARNLLVDMFQWPTSRTDGTKLPVVLMGHDVGNDIAKMHSHFGVNIGQYITAVVDTQELANQKYIRGPRGPKIGLKDLAKYFHLEPSNLHTAGNDIAYTAFLSVLVPLKKELYASPENPLGDPVPVVQGRHIQEVINNLSIIGRARLPPAFGRLMFCTKCDGEDHLRQFCRTLVRCEYCLSSTQPRLRLSAFTHKTEKCVMRPVTGAPRV